MKANNQFKNILVFNPAFLGDTIITTPLIRALHVLYPKAKISLCVLRLSKIITSLINGIL